LTGTVRIIAGQWRGRKLKVPNQTGLRPTPNRIRETLFNWLAIDLPGSRCLDLFAGSGALGIEAASRGAKQVVLIEKQRDIVQSLRQQVTSFAADNVTILSNDAIKFLKKKTDSFDIVFLDPPYGSNLLNSCCTLLQQGGWLNPQALIYLETDTSLAKPNLPESWQIIRQKNAGQVAAYLIRINNAIS
jgi:16S rRNA (guanine966-N2)-methyltransferase